MRAGLDRNTGEALTGWAECAQSISCIAQTAIGSLVLNRTFGSNIPALQDRPQNIATIGQYFVAIADALLKWEPGFRLTKITPIKLGADGVAAFDIAGIFYPNGHLGDFSAPEGKSVTVAPAGLIKVRT